MEPKEQNPDQMTEVVLQPTQPKVVSFDIFQRKLFLLGQTR